MIFTRPNPKNVCGMDLHRKHIKHTRDKVPLHSQWTEHKVQNNIEGVHW